MLIGENTNRGFHRGEFKDANGEKCSLQESSAARDEGLIWLGISDPRIVFVAGAPRDLPTPEGCSIFGRMHLTQSDVKRLLPALQHFRRDRLSPAGVSTNSTRADGGRGSDR